MKTHSLLSTLIVAAFVAVSSLSEAAVPRFAFVVNSFNDTISQYVIDDKAGRLIPNGLVSVNHFPSAVAVHPSNKFVFATSQSTAELHIYHLDNSTGRLREAEGSPIRSEVVSPFAITFSGNGKFVYVAGRLSSDIMGFEFNETKAVLEPIEGMPVKAVQRTRQFVMHPSGKYLYSVNAYADNVSGFQVDQQTGQLSKMAGSPYNVGQASVDMMVQMDETPPGITQGPYNLAVHPSGKFLFVCNWMSASISVFNVNERNGTLSLVDGSPFKSDPHPYGVVASPDGRYVYSYHWAMNTIVGFEVNDDTGKLRRLEKKGLYTLGLAPVDEWFDDLNNRLYLSHYFTHNVASYDYDSRNGTLKLNKSSPVRQGPRSLSVSYGEERMHFSSELLYLLSEKGNMLVVYKADGSGELQSITSVQLSGNPKDLAYDRVNNLVYVVTQEPSQLLAYQMVNDNELKLQTELPVGMKESPDSVAVGVNGLVVYVTSAAHDRLLVFERHPKTGEIKEWPESPRTTESYPTEITMDTAGRFAFVLNKKSNSISSYKYRDGLWPLVDKIQTPERLGRENSNIVAMAVDPLGNFIYAADSVNDEVLVFWINTQTGHFEESHKTEESEGSFFKVGRNPANMKFHPNGNWLYVVNSGDNSVGVYSIEHLYGKPAKTIQTIKTKMSPLAIEIDASGRSAYIRYKDSAIISLYSIDPASGGLQHKKDIASKVPVTDFAIDVKLY